MEKIKKITATFFYSGMFPYAPGTAGTIAAALLYIILWQLSWALFSVFLICTIAASLLNLWIGEWSENYFQCKDPKSVVIDEVAGFFLTIMLFEPSWFVLISGFILFRIFDIAKPYPINKLQSIKGGMGILIDDLLAGVFAGIILLVLSYLAHFQQFSLNLHPNLWNW